MRRRLRAHVPTSSCGTRTIFLTWYWPINYNLAFWTGFERSCLTFTYQIGGSFWMYLCFNHDAPLLRCIAPIVMTNPWLQGISGSMNDRALNPYDSVTKSVYCLWMEGYNNLIFRKPFRVIGILSVRCQLCIVLSMQLAMGRISLMSVIYLVKTLYISDYEYNPKSTQTSISPNNTSLRYRAFITS